MNKTSNEQQREMRQLASEYLNLLADQEAMVERAVSRRMTAMMAQMEETMRRQVAKAVADYMEKRIEPPP